MKATVKATGFTYNVTGFSDDGSLKLEDGNWYSMEELEIGEGYDWNQVRIQAAIAAMDIVKGAYNIHNDIERLVRHSVKIADALVTELQKKRGEQ